MRNIASTEGSNVLGILSDNRKNNEVFKKIRVSFNEPYYMYPKFGSPMDVKEINKQKSKTFYGMSLPEVQDILDYDHHIGEPEKATVLELVAYKDLKIKGQRGKEEGHLYYKCASNLAIDPGLFIPLTSKVALNETVGKKYLSEYIGWNSKSIMVADEYQYDGKYAADRVYDRELIKYNPGKTSFVSGIATAYLQQNQDKLKGYVYIAPFDTDAVNFVPFKKRRLVGGK